MTRTVKAFGLAIVVVLALGAWALPSAQAAEFHSESDHKTVTGSPKGNHMATIGGMTMNCKQVHIHETIEFGVLWNTITTKMEHTECTMAEAPATETNNNCVYSFHSNGEVDIGGASCTAIVYKATIGGLPCTLKIGPQTGLKTASYKNLGSGSSREIEMSLNLKGIKYTAEGAACKEAGTKTNGEMSDTIVLAAFDPATKLQMGMWIE
jgi:hypothetical protein